MQIAESALKFSGEEFRQKWKHKDTTYGFNPNMEEMTLGEITDLENYMNDPETYHKAMAVMYRPIKKETEHLGGLFQIEQYTGTGIRAGVMKELPLSYFFGVRTFFLTIGSELEMITRQFSTRSSTQKSKQSSD